VRAFEKGFHEFMGTKYPQVGEGLRTGKVLTKEIEADMKRGIEEFKKTFAPAKAATPAGITKADL
jgi:F-type H+-transporting ATPase subunit alpha